MAIVKQQDQGSTLLKMIRSMRLFSVVFLVIFVPVSALLVSLLGNYYLSALRDLALAIIIITGFVAENRNDKLNYFLVLTASLFILCSLGSYFVESGQASQWLRGVRFLAEPFLLFLSLYIYPLSGEKKIIYGTIFISALITICVAFVESLWPSLLAVSLNKASIGYLGTIHHAATLLRLQSSLAGPNALGLYLGVVITLSPLWRDIAKKWFPYVLVVLLLLLFATFSRSSFIGIVAGGSFFLFFARTSAGKSRKYISIALAIFVVAVAVLFIVKPQELIRAQSNDVRFQQYVRVWNEKSQIGLFGQGAGSAGPVSQYRLDGEGGNFTENTYLDVFEAVGLVGLISLVSFWLGLLVELVKRKNIVFISAASAVFFILVSGIFINYYTGQAAIWLSLLFAGLILGYYGQSTNEYI